MYNAPTAKIAVLAAKFQKKRRNFSIVYYLLPFKNIRQKVLNEGLHCEQKPFKINVQGGYWGFFKDFDLTDKPTKNKKIRSLKLWNFRIYASINQILKEG